MSRLGPGGYPRSAYGSFAGKPAGGGGGGGSKTWVQNFTAMSAGGYPRAPYGSFAGKGGIPSAKYVSLLGAGGYPRAPYGSFAGKPASVPPATSSTPPAHYFATLNLANFGRLG